MGRRAELDELVAALGGFDQNISLVGQPRVGKTSLVRAAIAAVAVPQSVAIVEITLSSVLTPTEFFRDLLDSAEASCVASGIELPLAYASLRALPASDSYTSFVRCKRGFQSLSRLGAKLMLVIDEFDAVLKFAEQRETIFRLRELVYQQHLYGASAIIISRRSLSSIEAQVDGVSNLCGVVSHVMFLRPLHREAMLVMAGRCRPAWELADGDIKALWALTGGHPFLSEMVLYYGWSAKSVDEGRGRAMFQVLQHYALLRKELGEEGLFDALVQASVGPRWSLTHARREQLVCYGLIDAETERAYSEHYQEYLERCAREGATMDLWRETEVGLRDFVQAVLIKEIGDNWEADLTTRHGAEHLVAIFNSARLIQERDKRSFGDCSPRVLDYLYPLDLWEVIAVYWSVFAVLLPVSGLQGKAQKSYWRQRFDLFAKVRNPTMHHRLEVIPASQVTTATGYCRELLERIRMITVPQVKPA